jgi:uncharacterized protein YjbJ (UPF0337 family)
MSNESDKSEGTAEKIGGTIKKGFGKLVGDEVMEAEGRAKELKGEARRESAKASERTKGKLEEVGGAIKNRVGRLIDDDEMAEEGKETELKGEDRQQSNR